MQSYGWNRTYFNFPLKVEDKEHLLDYLQGDSKWSAAPGIKTNYMLSYAKEMNDPADDRLLCYTVNEVESLPIYMFDAKIAENMKSYGMPSTGKRAKLKEISLYLFGNGVAFLEFCVDYSRMSMAEISEFIYLFRSLRNNESRKGLLYPENMIGVETAIKKLLPIDSDNIQLCFSNSSDIKSQANIYSLINPTLCADNQPDQEDDSKNQENRLERETDVKRWLHLISHGYNMKFDSDTMGNSSYEMIESFRVGDYWEGCQDGLACMVSNPYPYQANHLCRDYHFMYLMLLNQRFSLISYIDAFSKRVMDQEKAQEMYRSVVELKLRYLFRTISDDARMQTIYNRMYEVYKIDHLMKDLDESGDQLNEILQREHLERQRRFEIMIFVLSALALFSAFVDLSDYIEKFNTGVSSWPALISLAVNVAIVIVGLTIAFKKKR